MEDYFQGSHFENFQKLTDIIIYTEDGGKFKAHKILLAQSSKYFEKLFCGEFSPPITTVIPIIKSMTFNKILCYIYKSSDVLTHDSIADILLAADFLIMDNLFNDCKEFLLCSNGITIENCLKVYNALWKIELEKVNQICLRFIELHFDEIFENVTETLWDLSLAALTVILERENIFVSNESIVWNIVVTWISKDISERGLYFSDLLKFVRLQDIGDSSELYLLPVNNTNPFYYLSDEIRTTQLIATSMLLRQAKSLPKSMTGTLNKRGPKSVNFICKKTFRPTTEMYLTFDDNLDYWYLVTEHYFHVLLEVCIAGRLMFLYSLNQPDPLTAFDFIEETFIEISPVPHRRHSFSIVSVKDVLYAVGGRVSQTRTEDEENLRLADVLINIQHELEQINLRLEGITSSDEEQVISEHINENDDDNNVIHDQDTDNDDDLISLTDEDDDANEWINIHDDLGEGSTTLQFYDVSSNTWREAKSMQPVHIIRVVSLNDYIYVIGESVNYESMICQFYDPIQDQWTVIPSPETHRTDCAAVEYNGCIYLIGGTDRYFLNNQKVEEYNPIRNSWKVLPDLPFRYLDPVVFVFCNTLIVFEQSLIFSTSFPAVHWNLLENKWKIVDFINREVLAVISNCHVVEIESANLINEIIEDRKHKKRNWEKSSLFSMNKEDFPKYISA